jgi:hypothetical protein
MPGFLDSISGRVSAETRELYDVFARDFGPAYVSVFQRGHVTVIHGDAHPYNIMLPKRGDGAGRIIDWQFHHVSVCTQDICHALGLDWSTEVRRLLERDVLQGYYQRLVAGGARNYAWEDCWHGYRVAAIDNLFMPMWQWTLGMPEEGRLLQIDRAIAAVRDLGCLELLQ